MKNPFSPVTSAGAAFLIAALTIPAMAFAATATTTDRFSISPAHPEKNTPSWLVYNIKPGDTIKDEVVVTNDSENSITLSLYAVDKEVSTEKDAFSPAAKDVQKMTVGKWTTLNKSLVTLAPKTTEKVGLTFTVPADTAEQEYAGAVVAELAPAAMTATKGNDVKSMSISTRVGLRLYATVSKTAVTSDPMKTAQSATTATNADSGSNLLTPTNILIGLAILLLLYILGKSVIGSKSKKK